MQDTLTKPAAPPTPSKVKWPRRSTAPRTGRR
ncbi:hypothetical protein CSX04_02668 [Burkholderia cepacia]|nr:hypothetical protein CSX04_02668 [Burkholderia cepacia]